MPTTEMSLPNQVREERAKLFFGKKTEGIVPSHRDLILATFCLVGCDLPPNFFACGFDVRPKGLGRAEEFVETLDPLPSCRLRHVNRTRLAIDPRRGLGTESL